MEQACKLSQAKPATRCTFSARCDNCWLRFSNPGQPQLGEYIFEGHGPQGFRQNH